jgi:hypothetical protein
MYICLIISQNDDTQIGSLVNFVFFIGIILHSIGRLNKKKKHRLNSINSISRFIRSQNSFKETFC